MEKELQEKLAQTEKDLAQAKEYAAKIEGEKKVLEEKATAESLRVKELADSQRTEQIKNFVEQLGKEGKVLPKHSAIVTAVLESVDDSKVVKFTVDGKEEEKSVKAMFEAMLSDMPKLVDFTEKSKADGKDEFVPSSDPMAGSAESQILDHKAKLYMQEHKECEYKDAVIAVSKSEVK